MAEEENSDNSSADDPQKEFNQLTEMTKKPQKDAGVESIIVKNDGNHITGQSGNMQNLFVIGNMAPIVNPFLLDVSVLKALNAI